MSLSLWRRTCIVLQTSWKMELWSNEIINVKLVGVIADAPAMAKNVNMNQYNGYFGCVHCLHPGERLENFSKTVFPYSKTKKPRLNCDYLPQVYQAQVLKNLYGRQRKLLDITIHKYSWKPYSWLHAFELYRRCQEFDVSMDWFKKGW